MNQQVSLPGSSEPPGLAAATGTSQSDATEPSVMHPEVQDLRNALAAAEARERLLQHELQHRVRNMLAVIRYVYRRSRESVSSPEEFADHFEGRLHALARYQSFVDDVGRSGIELEDMLRDELLETRYLDGPNCTISGPAVYLRQKWAEMMGLAIHELTTNSIKFGALMQGGKLLVEWSVSTTGESTLLRFRWSETDISAIAPAPRPSGFGQQLIEEALPYQLGARTTFDFKPGSFECLILLPLPCSVGDPRDGNHAAPSKAALLPGESEWSR